MRKIHDHLCVGYIVNSGDDAVTNPESLMDDLDHRSQTVGRTRSCRDDVMFVR